MKQCVVLSLLVLGLLCAHGAPVDQGTCTDAQALGAASLALTEINKDLQEGFILSLYRMANVNVMKHGETGVVFYLTLDVVETDCHVLSRKDWKKCEARTSDQTPVYGQCKASIFINKVHRVVRLYKYDCTIRPASKEKVIEMCPDCPSHMAKDNERILSTAAQSLEKFNKESGLANRFAMLNVTRATASMGGMAMFYNVEYTVQETSCANNADSTKAEECPIMTCEFAHKGHCKGSFSQHPGGEDISVECEIYEPETAEKEKKLHLLGGKTDHGHTDAHAEGGVDHTHDAAHAATEGHTHDHAHDHTKTHRDDAAHTHEEGSDHHHTHDHDGGLTHSHAHSHDHGHGHDHVHAHHAKAHDHSGDLPNQHHAYHTADAHTHEHDHEVALDHEHKHLHLHEHEHHHHHHDHTHEPHRHPEGMVRVLPALGQPMTLPSFPDQPVGGPDMGVILPLVADPDIPGEREPTIVPFPTAVAPNCPAAAPTKEGIDLVAKLFAEDPMFKAAA